MDDKYKVISITWSKRIAMNDKPIIAQKMPYPIEVGLAYPIYLRKTNEKALELIPLEILKKYAIDL